jgi:hypothetical protein
LVDIELLAVSDAELTGEEHAISGVSSEPDVGIGFGNVPDDIVIIDGDLQLRAERYSSDGRTYWVDVIATVDGQVKLDSVVVVVDRDQRNRRNVR